MCGGVKREVRRRYGKRVRKRGERVRDLAQSLSQSDLEQGRGSGTAQLRPPPRPLIPYWLFQPFTSQPPNERAQARANNEQKKARTYLKADTQECVHRHSQVQTLSSGSVMSPMGLRFAPCVTAHLSDTGGCENDNSLRRGQPGII